MKDLSAAAIASVIADEFTPHTTVDPLKIMVSDYERYQDALSAWFDLTIDTDTLIAEGMSRDEAAEQLMDQHATLADLLGLTPTTDEFPVVFQCGCGKFGLWNRDTATVTVWDGERELNETVPHCGCRNSS